MPVKDDLLEILCCPLTKVSLKVVDADTVAMINDRIAAGEVQYESGAAVTDPLEEALATVDNQRLYAIKDSIPVMLVDESIPAAQLGETVQAKLAGSGS